MPQNRSPDRVVVVGASAGGIQAACTVLAGLPADFPFPIFIVVHVNRERSELAQVLGRCGPLSVAAARHGETFRGSRVYVAPPNRHLLIEDTRVALSPGPRENRFRPAVDPLFRTAARVWRADAIGIILSGALDDGAAGAFAIKARGGTVIVQDPADAVVSSMPQSARKSVEVDYCLPAAEIAPLLVRLSQEDRHMPTRDANEKTIHEPITGKSAAAAGDLPKGLVPFVCPDCSGPMYEVKEGKLVQFRCIIGHAYSPYSLDAAHVDALERAIWVAIRTLKERLNVQRVLAAEVEGTEQGTEEYIEAIEHDIALLEQIQQRL